MGTVEFESGEASNPGPPRTRARGRMEREAENALTGLEPLRALMIRQTTSSPCQRGGMKSARVQRWVEVQTFVTCGHVWVRVTQPSFQNCWIHWEPSNLVPGDVGGHSDDGGHWR